MQLINTLSVLAVATSAVVAMPAMIEERGWGGGSNRWWPRPHPGAVITFTAYDPQPTDWDTTTPAAATPTSTEVEVTATPAAGGGFYQGQPPQGPPPQAWTPTTDAPAPPQTEAPAASSPPPSSGGSGPSGGQDGYLDVVTKWRLAGGLPALSQDS